jgi:hypothetical protein
MEDRVFSSGSGLDFDPISEPELFRFKGIIYSPI